VRKWLGNERLQAMVLGSGADGAQKVQDFKHGPIFKMLITSYETVRKHAAELAGTCDLLVCDEGHRLKSAGQQLPLVQHAALRGLVLCSNIYLFVITSAQL
jgi:DNA repair and recombination protein RAD54B